jgi:hypothetical protein
VLTPAQKLPTLSLAAKKGMRGPMSQSEDDPADDFKAYRTIRPTEPTTSPNPEEGLRLVRAFLRIKNPTLREAVIHFVEDLAGVD